MKNILKKIKIPKFLGENKYIKGRKNIFIPALILIAIIIVLSFLESFFGIISLTFFGSDVIKKETREILSLQKQLQSEQTQYGEILVRQQKISAQNQEYWITKRDGDINIKFQEKISAAAKKANVELSTAGSVQVSNISDDLSMGEVEISCSGDMKGITNFIYAMTYSTPKMYWERFSLRPDNYN